MPRLSLPQLRPTALYAASLVLFLMACAVFYADSQVTAARKLALRGDPPAPVAVGAFDPSRDVGATGEVAIRAQIDTAMPIQVLHRAGLIRRRALAYPVLAVDGGPAAPVLGYFYVDAPLPHVEVMDMARLLPLFDKVGDLGPIAVLNGEIGAPDRVSAGIAKVLHGQGRQTADPLLAIAYYAEGRAVALSRRHSSPWFRALMAAALGLAMLGGIASIYLPRRHERDRLARIAAKGRSRGMAATAPAGNKGRDRLSPLAPQPEPPRPRRRSSAWLLLRHWQVRSSR